MTGQKNGFASCLFLVNVFYKHVLHNGIKSACGFVENKNFGIVHKRGYYRKFTLYAQAHAFGVAIKHLVAKLEHIKHAF